MKQFLEVEWNMFKIGKTSSEEKSMRVFVTSKLLKLGEVLVDTLSIYCLQCTSNLLTIRSKKFEIFYPFFNSCI